MLVIACILSFVYVLLFSFCAFGDGGAAEGDGAHRVSCIVC